MKHNIVWHKHAWEDYLYWFEHDKKIIRKINELIKDCDRNPFSGLGKPEPLKYHFQNCWSRRITQEHRLVYMAEKNELIIIACRYHYE